VKRYTSSFFHTIAAAFIGFPIFYIIGAATIFNISLQGCARILLSPYYYFVSICAMIAGYGLWEMRRWSWYVFLLAHGLIVYENAILVSNFAETHHKIFVFVNSIIFQVLLILKVAREIRVPHFFPKIRWWESNPRYKLSIPVGIQCGSDQDFSGKILDISRSGCFIKLRLDVPVDTNVVLNFSIFGYPLVLNGSVVWCTLGGVTHPRGVGVMFAGLSRDQKRILRAIVARLRQISSHYRRFRYLMDPADFQRELEEIEGAPFSRSVVGAFAADRKTVKPLMGSSLK
jgi:hypothetical protein